MSSKHTLSFSCIRKHTQWPKVTKERKSKELAKILVLFLLALSWAGVKAQSLNAWGSYYNGKESPAAATPIVFSSLSWKMVSAGDRFALAIKNDGTLWGWGDNSKGGLGIGADLSQKNNPVQIGTDNTWSTIDVSYLGSSYAIKKDGSLWSWGDNRKGQLGYGTNEAPQLTPRQVGSATDWKDVKAGDFSVLALKKNGSIWTAGTSAFGQLGDATDADRAEFKQVGTDLNWSTIAAGAEHYLAIKTDGSLWAWGLNASGQLGDGTVDNRNTPVRIGSSNNWKCVASRFASSFAIDNQGVIWATGDNSYGQLGDGTETNRTTYSKIGTDTDWKIVAPGDFHTVAVKKDGSLWSWGWNSNGQLGDATVVSKLSPTRSAVAGKVVYAESGWTDVFCLVQTTPDTPTNVQALAGNAFNTLNWSAVTEANVTGFRIYGGTEPGILTLMDTVKANISSYIHNNLMNGTTYYYRLAAYNSYGESEYSPLVQATPKDLKPTITLNALAAKQYGDADFEISAKTNFTGLEKNITYNSSNPEVAVITNGKVRITGIGSTQIVASLDGPSSFNGISAAQELIVTKAGQIITGEKLPTLHLDGKSHDLKLNCSSGLPLQVKSLNPFILKADGNTLIPEGVGTATIIVTQEGNENYLPAEATFNIVVAAGEQEINVHQAVSPNGDGINDNLILDGLGLYSDYELVIVNRNGTKILEANQNATSMSAGRTMQSGSASVECKLPEIPAGTYFYALKFKDAETWKHQTGYFVLKY